MNTNKIIEDIQRHKIKAERFLRQHTKAFIKDSNNTYYFCEVIGLEESGIIVKNFQGPRKFETDRIYWEDIITFKEYEVRE